MSHIRGRLNGENYIFKLIAPNTATAILTAGDIVEINGAIFNPCVNGINYFTFPVVEKKDKSTEVKNMEFKVGDKVDWLGMKGEVTYKNADGLMVTFPSMKTSFSHDGRYMPDQQPSLKLIERAKIKKEVKVWGNIYKDFSVFHENKEEADESAIPGRIALATGTLTYEVDEE